MNNIKKTIISVDEPIDLWQDLLKVDLLANPDKIFKNVKKSFYKGGFLYKK